MFGSFAAHSAETREAFKAQIAKLVELRAKSEPEKIKQGFTELQSQLAAAETCPPETPHLFQGVTMTNDSHQNDVKLQVERSDHAPPDEITQKVDDRNNVSSTLKGNPADRSYEVFALTNAHLAPIELQYNPNPEKVLKVLEAFIKMEILLGHKIDINIGENAKHFEKSDCPQPMKDLYKLLTEDGGNGYKRAFTALSTAEQASRELGRMPLFPVPESPDLSFKSK